jgi:hypothetical protein
MPDRMEHGYAEKTLAPPSAPVAAGDPLPGFRCPDCGGQMAPMADPGSEGMLLCLGCGRSYSSSDPAVRDPEASPGGGSPVLDEGAY